MPDLYYAATCQTDFPCPERHSEIAERTRRMCAIAEQTITGYEPFFDVRLLVFPEFAHAAPIYDNVKALRRHLALPLPNDHTEAYERLCRKYGCYIQTGSFLEADPDYPDCVFNTTVLMGPDGILSRYRKVNTWIPWELHASPHDIVDYAEDPFPVVDTELGRLGVAICYDWLFPETIRQIAFNGAEVICRVSAYMDPWGATSLAHYPPFSWPGGSMVVNYDGLILAQADPGPGEKVVVAPIDITALRAERERRTGHDTRAHLRSEIHRYSERGYLPRGEDQPVTGESLRERIRSAKRGL
jgi:formamidase